MGSNPNRSNPGFERITIDSIAAHVDSTIGSTSEFCTLRSRSSNDRNVGRYGPIRKFRRATSFLAAYVPFSVSASANSGLFIAGPRRYGMNKAISSVQANSVLKPQCQYMSL